MQASALWAIALVNLLISALEDNLLVDTLFATLPQNKQIKNSGLAKKLDLPLRYTEKG